MSIRTAIKFLKAEMEKEGIRQEDGLGEELFLFSSTLAPVVNVDLIVTNRHQQILLAWRDDPYCGTGWHFPGGCVRFRERLEERVQKTAISEIGCSVVFEKEPIKMFEIFSDGYRIGLKDQKERSHFITIVYKCQLPKGWKIENSNVLSGKPGYLKWFDVLPNNLLTVQQCYCSCWEEICSKLWRKKNDEMDN